MFGVKQHHLLIVFALALAAVTLWFSFFSSQAR